MLYTLPRGSTRARIDFLPVVINFYSSPSVRTHSSLSLSLSLSLIPSLYTSCLFSLTQTLLSFLSHPISPSLSLLHVHPIPFYPLILCVRVFCVRVCVCVCLFPSPSLTPLPLSLSLSDIRLIDIVSHTRTRLYK